MSRILWSSIFVCAVSLALGTAACKSKDKATPEAAPAQDSDKAEQAKTDDKVANRRPVPPAPPRKGFVEVSIDGQTKRFEVLPTDKNRLVPSGTPPLLLLDAYAEGPSKEHFRIMIQNVKFADMTGRSLIARDRRNPKPPSISLVYEDDTGERYVGTVRVGGTADLVVETFDTARGLAAGTFSGKLKGQKNGKEIAIEDGRFSTERAS